MPPCVLLGVRVLEAHKSLVVLAISVREFVHAWTCACDAVLFCPIATPTHHLPPGPLIRSFASKGKRRDDQKKRATFRNEHTRREPTPTPSTAGELLVVDYSRSLCSSFLSSPLLPAEPAVEATIAAPTEPVSPHDRPPVCSV